MLWFWCSAVPDSCLCGLKYLFEVAQGLRTREPWLGYPVLATGRNVQHPERHLQNPTSRDVFQAAICYQPAPFDEGGMHPYCPAVPWMPRIPDFTDIPNMGVVLLSCTIISAHQALGYRTPADLVPRQSIRKKACLSWGVLPWALP